MKTNQLRPRYFIFALLTVAVVTSGVFAQTTGARVSTETELNEDLSTGPCKNRDRVDAVKKLFIKMGVPEADVKAEEIKGIQNVLVTKKGKTDETVIIG